jgi:glucosamine--fructose-6-phosphate aminotransferase (isomerizing)
VVAGKLTRKAIAAQPEWLSQVPTGRRLPDGRIAVVGCGTSFHAAQTSGAGYDALEFVLAPPEADVLVLVSHEGTTPLTIEAAEAFAGPKWLVTAKAESPLAALCDEVVVATPAVEESYCHTASYTAAVATLAALRGEDVSWLPAAVADELAAERLPVSGHERWLFAGAGRDWPTVQEAALKLREGVYLAVEAYQLEELLHGHLAAVDESVRCFVLQGEGRAAARAAEAVAALRELGCDTMMVPTRHPVVDIVRFQLLTLDLAEARDTEPDLIRWDDPRWKRARDSYR